jgi:Tfp pilus assembly pilus retraction ATPase PilT
MTFEELMDYAIENECSDVHITEGTNLAVRRYGILHILDERPTVEESKAMIYTILTPHEIERVESGEDLDIGVMIDNEVRIRANIYHQRNNLAASIRILMSKIPEFDDLGLPEAIKSLATAQNGLLLVTGPTGSGKTTTMAAVVDYINKNANKDAQRFLNYIPTQNEIPDSIINIPLFQQAKLPTDSIITTVKTWAKGRSLIKNDFPNGSLIDSSFIKQ